MVASSWDGVYSRARICRQRSKSGTRLRVAADRLQKRRKLNRGDRLRSRFGRDSGAFEQRVGLFRLHRLELSDHPSHLLAPKTEHGLNELPEALLLVGSDD